MPDSPPATEVEGVPALVPIPLDEATSVVRPERGPWVWSEPIRAISCDSWKWVEWPSFHPDHGPYEDRVARSAIENLYAAGYAIVRLPEAQVQR